MNKRLRLMTCALAVTFSLSLVLTSANIGPIGVDVVSAATTEVPAPAPKSTAVTTAKPAAVQSAIYTSGTNITRFLALGSSGSDVKLLQTMLNNNGYNLTVDGFFGSLTETAVKDFQSKNGLKVDGVVGPRTLEKLKPAPTGTATEIAGVTRLLAVGTQGNDVEVLQAALNNNGYKLIVDGILGSLTEAAVKAYQGKKGLAVDGIVGPKTLASLAVSGDSKKVLYIPGTYSASVKGFDGDIIVTITVDANKITNAKVEGSKETPGIGGQALEKLSESIMSKQSAEVDVVTGATETSSAAAEAAKKAISKAKGETTQVGKISFKPGTYTSTEKGMEGKFNITATFSDNAIKSIKIGDNHETLMLGTEAIKILPDRIVKNQSLNVDAITGATVTSNAVISGVKDCVQQAEGNLNALLAAPVTVNDYNYDNLTHDADVIVVGGGLAGITTAISARQNGAKVILLEQKEYLGGNSALSTGEVLLGGTSVQKDAGITDDSDTFYKWILQNSDNAKDPVQAGWIAYHGQQLIDWFASLGIKFDKKVLPTDASKINRGHIMSPNVGTALSTLVDNMNKLGVDVRYSTKVNSIIKNDAGEIIGVNATDYNGNPVKYTGKEIVLATGGFADNHNMIVNNWGTEYNTLVYGGAKGMDGTGINAAVALGAATVDMNVPHVDATLEVNKGITLTTDLLRSCGGILIRQSTGQRFVDEQASHSEVAAAKIHELGDKYFYEIFDNNAFNVSEAVTSKVQSYIDMGLTTKYDSIEAMAKGLNLNADTLKQTLDKYNSAVRGETKDEFGRQGFFKELAAPFYVIKVSNGVAATVGGLKVDKNMEVVDTNGKPLPNLYAVGEVVGGYLTHYVGGDSLGRSAISGMLIGKELSDLNGENAK